MKAFLSIIFLSVFALFSCKSLGQKKSSIVSNHFIPDKYLEVPINAIKPKGWLLNQLKIMRKGTTGHLDEVYEKLKNDNGWLGGKGDGWEETPYWLDGAVPLAYLLDDQNLKEKILGYINWALDHQRISGYFGPITKWERSTGRFVTATESDKGEDWWPKMVMLKVLQQYYSASNDPRVIKFMKSYFHYQYLTLKNAPLGKWSEWATYRGQDNIMTIAWLYGITKSKELLELSDLMWSQTAPWSNHFKNRDWVMNAAAHQDDKDWMSRHGVNVAMGLKDPVIHYKMSGNDQYLRTMKTGYSDIMRLHGLPNGMFSADEDLHGNEPTQGSEMCAVVESMFSLEQIIGITGDPEYMDALERITFNALPAQTTDDYNNKQYFQIANQVVIKRGVFNFSLPFGREMNNVLGMRSGYTCCLANMHQGWTKFATHLWYKTPGNGVAALAYSPNQITTQVGKSNDPVTIDEITNYPFDDNISFKITSKNETTFPIQLRIPLWCSDPIIQINGKVFSVKKSDKLITIKRSWKTGDEINLQLPMAIRTSGWGRNSKAIERGPLVYALKIEEDWQKGNEEREGEYFSVFPKSDWNYGILQNNITDPIKFLTIQNVKPISDSFVWNLNNVPIEISASAKKIPEWKIVDDVAPQPVTDRDGAYRGKVDKTIEKITLVPYGCTKIRIVAFPVVE